MANLVCAPVKRPAGRWLLVHALCNVTRVIHANQSEAALIIRSQCDPTSGRHILLHAPRVPKTEASIRIPAEMWMFKDLRKHFAGSYGLELFGDLDYQAALVQSNPHHKVCELTNYRGCVLISCRFNSLPHIWVFCACMTEKFGRHTASTRQ